MIRRRQLLQAGSSLGALGLLSGCAGMSTGSRAHVVVVGGGYGGATTAKYLRMWSEGKIRVTLVEPNPSFISCPLSNLVVGGSKTLADITSSYDKLSARARCRDGA